MITSRRRLGAVGPYLAVCGVVVAGFFVQGRNTDRIEQEGIARDRAICEDGNERAASVRVFVRLLVTPEDGEEMRPEAREIIALADEVFAAKDCEQPRESPG